MQTGVFNGMMKKILSACIIFLLMAVFVLIPSPTSKLYVRIYFDEIQGDICSLYYADDLNTFSQEQCVSSAIDHDRQMVEFALEPFLEGRLTGLRLDFPDEEQLFCIRNITVSNGGVIKREFNPSQFFAQENIQQSNSIDEISLATARARAYVRTFSDDPYVVLSGELCQQFMGCYSHYRLTKLAVCVFLSCCFFLAKKRIFTED